MTDAVAPGGSRPRWLSALAFVLALVALSLTTRLPAEESGDEILVTLSGGVSMALVRVPAGAFTMGSPDDERGRGGDETAHTVTLSSDYYLGKFEVTQAQWQAVTGEDPAAGHGVGPDHPVYNVTWEQVAGPGGFLDQLNAYLESTEQAGAGPFRLPTEAEWEMAARAGSSTRFCFGDATDCDDLCGSCSADPYLWWCGDAGSSQAVGQKPANALGLFDMHGNVSEWVMDRYAPYAAGPRVDPLVLVGGSCVRRGGSWGENLYSARAATRVSSSCSGKRSVTGFRIARSTQPAPLAGFSWSPEPPRVGEEVAFTDLSSGSPTSWTWSFGDGRTSDLQHPAVRFAAPGSYTVTLEARRGADAGSTSMSVTVAPFPNVTPRLRRRLSSAPLSGRGER